MNRFSILLVIAILLLACVVGCSRPTMVETADERDFRIMSGWELDRRMIVEDFDTTMLMNHNSLMSQWHVRQGY